MSSEERKQILKMVEDGRISAKDAMKLIAALDDSSVEVEQGTGGERVQVYIG